VIFVEEVAHERCWMMMQVPVDKCGLGCAHSMSFLLSQQRVDHEVLLFDGGLGGRWNGVFLEMVYR
jgi:hypothetical protein